MVILAVNQRDVHGCFGETLCDREPAETGADNDHARLPSLGAALRHEPHSVLLPGRCGKRGHAISTAPVASAAAPQNVTAALNADA